MLNFLPIFVAKSVQYYYTACQTSAILLLVKFISQRFSVLLINFTLHNQNNENLDVSNKNKIL